MRKLIGLTLLLVLAACVEPASKGDNARVLVVGDSMLAWNGDSGNAVSHMLERMVGEEVIDRSVIGARFLYPLPISGSLGLNISSQYVDGDWDTVIVNGGGNDIWIGCGCGRCDRLLDRLITKDGRSGKVAQFLNGLAQKGIDVIFVGYLRSPGVASGFETCVDEGNEYESRIAALARRSPRISFVSMADLVPLGDRSFHVDDMVHPSRKGSRAIAQRVAPLLR